jgi:ABC-2 type transport system ATP-binding protein
MQQALMGEPHVLGVAQIGSDLRVLTDTRDDSGDSLRERVLATDPNAHIEPVAANLEDVFVASTHKSGEPAAEKAA